MKKVLFFLLLLSSAVFAFTVEYTQDTIWVPVDGTRETDVTITSASADSFVITPLDTKTWVTYDQNIVQANANEPKKFTVLMSPTSSVPLGLHQVSLNVESQSTKESKNVNLFVQVFKSEGAEIENFLVTGDLVPSGVVNVKFSVKNIGEVKLQNLEVSLAVASPSGKIYESKEVVSLEPQGLITIERTFALKEAADFGDYKVNIKVVQLDKILDELNEKFVVAKKAIVKDETETEINLLKKSTTITFRNVGNAPSDEIVFTERITSFDTNFFLGDAPDDVQSDLYLWRVPAIAPGGSYRIQYSLDYTPLFYLLVILSAFAWIYLTKIRTVRVSKYIMQKKHIREGEEFTVGVEVKNYSGKAVNELEIFDFVPPIFELKDTHGPKPEKKKSEAGIELKWKINNLQSNEDRVLTYKIIPVLELSGMIKLPQASVAFVSGKKEIENQSNAAYIGIDTEKPALHHHIQHHLHRFFKRKD